MKSNPNNYIFLFFLVFIQLVGCNSPNIAVSTLTNSPPTSTRIPTDIPAPTISPLPTNTPEVFSFSNLNFTLNVFDEKTSSPDFYSDKFPGDISIFAIIFDYDTSGTAHLDWELKSENGQLISNGVLTFASGIGSIKKNIELDEYLPEGKYILDMEYKGEKVLKKGFTVGNYSTVLNVAMDTQVGSFIGLDRIINVFDKFTTSVIISYPVTSMNLNDNVSLILFKEDEIINESSWVWTYPSTSGWEISVISFNKFDEPYSPGDYTLFIYINDELANCGLFSVSDYTEDYFSLNYLENQTDCLDLERRQISGKRTIKRDLGNKPKTGWDRYLLRTYVELSKLTNTVLENYRTSSDQFFVWHEMFVFPTRLQVTFEGEIRPSRSGTLQIIENWLGDFSLGATYTPANDMFPREVLFSQGMSTFWMPVQDPLVEFMIDELEAGDKIEIFCLWVGAFLENDKMEFIYIVNAW